MEIKPEFVPPRCAIPLPYLGLENEEAQLAESLLRNLIQVEMQTHRIGAALALLELSETLPLPPSDAFRSLGLLWRQAAFREGAMSLDAFIKAADSAAKLIGRCVTIMPLIDAGRLSAATGAFRDRFQNPEKIRHSAAHPEYYPNLSKPMDGDARSIGARVVDFRNQRVSGSFHDRTYFATFAGTTVFYDLTAETVVFLVDLVKEIFSAFDRVTVAEIAQLRAQG